MKAINIKAIASANTTSANKVNKEVAKIERATRTTALKAYRLELKETSLMRAIKELQKANDLLKVCNVKPEYITINALKFICPKYFIIIHKAEDGTADSIDDRKIFNPSTFAGHLVAYINKGGTIDELIAHG